jgi:hypothetical protein
MSCGIESKPKAKSIKNQNNPDRRQTLSPTHPGVFKAMTDDEFSVNPFP